jgi:hypothetical protein
MWAVCISVLALHLPYWFLVASGYIRARHDPCEQTHPEILVGLIPSTLVWLLWLLWLLGTPEAQKPSPWSVGKTVLGWSLFIVLCAVACPSLQRSSVAANQALAVSNLRLIRWAEETYAEAYHQGFSDSLAALGPARAGGPASASAADLIRESLASGKESGYTFEYRPAPRDRSGFVKTFTVSARPVPPGRCGWSLLTNETGVIHHTKENRPATANDPSIGK